MEGSFNNVRQEQTCSVAPADQISTVVLQTSSQVVLWPKRPTIVRQIWSVQEQNTAEQCFLSLQIYAFLVCYFYSQWYTILLMYNLSQRKRQTWHGRASGPPHISDWQSSRLCFPIFYTQEDVLWCTEKIRIQTVLVKVDLSITWRRAILSSP